MRRKSKKSALIVQEVGVQLELERHRSGADCPAIAQVRCNPDYVPGELEMGDAAMEAVGQTDFRQRRFSTELVRDAQAYLEVRFNRQVSEEEVFRILTRLLEFGRMLRDWRS